MLNTCVYQNYIFFFPHLSFTRTVNYSKFTLSKTNVSQNSCAFGEKESNGKLAKLHFAINKKSWRYVTFGVFPSPPPSSLSFL